MFMSFKCCDENGDGTGNAVGINLKNINYIERVGRWADVAIEPTFHDVFAGPTFAEYVPTPPRRQTTGRRATRAVFTITPGCVMICFQQSTHYVLADYDELIKMLESLNNMFEG
jgi:hypothetical protein